MFGDINEKIGWINKNCNRAVTKEVRAIILRCIQESFAYHTIPERVIELMALDTTYTYLKNSRWIGVPLFAEIYCDYLICSFSLDREATADLVIRLNLAMKDLLPGSELDTKSDKEFLRFLFLCTSMAKTGEEAYSHFGFGTNIFKRIKNAVEITAEMSRDELASDQARFIAEIDAALVEVIFDITEEYTKNPGVVDLHKLSLIIGDMQPTEKVLVHGVGIEKLLNTLVTLGSKRQLTTAELQRHLNMKSEESKNLLEALQRVDLLFVIEASNSPAKVKWSLSELGLEIAAPSFAQKFWASFSPSEWKSIFLQNAFFQEATIAFMPVSLIQQCLELSLDQLKSLAPRSLAALFKLLESQGLHVIGEQLAKRILTSEAISPWLRIETCDYLSLRADRDEIRHLLQNVAESDVSVSVRDAALLGLTNGRDINKASSL